MRTNRPFFGFFIGALLPILGFCIVVALLKGGNSFGGFTDRLFINHRLAALVISLSILINAIPFAYFNSKRLDYTARGIFVATMLYAVFIILLRFVWS